MAYRRYTLPGWYQCEECGFVTTNKESAKSCCVKKRGKKMKVIKQYVSEDGKIFDSMEACREHEKSTCVDERLIQFVSSRLEYPDPQTYRVVSQLLISHKYELMTILSILIDDEE
jgi:hypothetical protein